jgi:hypothetical protein
MEHSPKPRALMNEMLYRLEGAISKNLVQCLQDVWGSSVAYKSLRVAHVSVLVAEIGAILSRHVKEKRMRDRFGS